MGPGPCVCPFAADPGCSGVGRAGSLLRVLLAQELIQHEVWKHSLSGLLGFWVGVNDKVLASGCH